MNQKEKQAFLFRFKWINRMSRLNATQIALLIKTMNSYAQKYDISEQIKQMNEKTLIVWELIQEDMQEDMQAYENKCERLRKNASLGGQARNRNIIANASKSNQMLANASKCKQIERDNDSDSNNKEKIYKKESSICYDLEELIRANFNDIEVANKFSDFLKMRASLKNNKEVSSVETLEALILKLRSIAKSKQDALSILENSIINNLTDLYPTKDSKKSTEVKYAN